MACDKFTYPTRQAAIDAMVGMKVHPHAGRKRKKHTCHTVYQCPKCGQYHMTSGQKRPLKDKRVKQEVATVDRQNRYKTTKNQMLRIKNLTSTPIL
jgi:hypothetical protein